MRHHGEIVRIEIARDELRRALDPSMASQFTSIFKSLGFKFVTLDLEGFRSGSMNALLAAGGVAPSNRLRDSAFEHAWMLLISASYLSAPARRYEIINV